MVLPVGILILELAPTTVIRSPDSTTVCEGSNLPDVTSIMDTFVMVKGCANDDCQVKSSTMMGEMRNIDNEMKFKCTGILPDVCTLKLLQRQKMLRQKQSILLHHRFKHRLMAIGHCAKSGNQCQVDVFACPGPFAEKRAGQSKVIFHGFCNGYRAIMIFYFAFMQDVISASLTSISEALGK
jgi:hypothetical protein